MPSLSLEKGLLAAAQEAAEAEAGWAVRSPLSVTHPRARRPLNHRRPDPCRQDGGLRRSRWERQQKGRSGTGRWVLGAGPAPLSVSPRGRTPPGGGLPHR